MSDAIGIDNEVTAWLAFAAMKVAAEILAITASAPDFIRKAIEQPSQVDLAIVARLANLLTPPAGRLPTENVFSI